jgi:hypothetical protein
MPRSWFSLLALVLALVGCEAPSVRSGAAGEQVVQSSSKRAPAKPGDVVWGDAIVWRDWDAALRAAKAENKSVCLVVYAD